jgi:hypothetical protein
LAISFVLVSETLTETFASTRSFLAISSCSAGEHLTSSILKNGWIAVEHLGIDHNVQANLF